jgi:flagellum-specific peptidoglycan hydrolase FlgJ
LSFSVWNTIIPETTEVPKTPLVLDEFTSDALFYALLHCEVLHPEIVYAQAILETGHFKSRIYREYNNLFGLYNSYKGDFYKFDHWTESIQAYKKYIQYKYEPPGSYYHFLEDLGYAEDPDYIYKVKDIVKRYEKDNKKRRRNRKSYQIIHSTC